MTQLTEQLSAIRNTQLEAQLDVFRTLSNRALDSAGQLFALNIKTSRQSVDQAGTTFRHLLDARDPRDLLAVGKEVQGQWQNLLSYSREVFGIATGMPVLNWISATPPSPAAAPHQLPTPAPVPAPTPAPALEVPATYAQGLEQAAIIAAADAATPEAVAPAVQTSVLEATESTGAMAAAEAFAEAAAEAAIADDMPPAAQTPVAQALQEIAPLPASAEHPIAAPVFLDADGEVELPVVDPVDHAPPVHVTSGPATKATRGSRRK
jgi:hypothetical protein